MFRRVLVAVALAVTAAAVPGVALASDWPWPMPGPILLPYAATWTEPGGKACSHGGLDIGGGAGATVEACVAGRVAFAGRIPAAGGGSALAVSVTTPDGLRVTYMPLADTDVVAGADVAPGERLGALAASGDASSAAPHLHLSVRRGEAPIDPATLLSAPGGSSGVAAEPPAPASGQAAAPTVRPQSPRVAAGAAAASAPALSRAAQAAGAPAAVPAPAGAGVLARVDVPLQLGPRLESRIAYLPREVRLDLRAALSQGRALLTAGRGIAARLLVAALALLLLVRALGVAARGLATGAAGQTLPVKVHGGRR